MKPIAKLLAQCRRLHPFTWCVVLVVALAMVLIVVPGDGVDIAMESDDPWANAAIADVYEQSSQRLQDQGDLPQAYAKAGVYEHGWPQPFLVRSLAIWYPRQAGLMPSEFRTRSRPLIRFKNGVGCYGPIPAHVCWSNADNWPLESDEVRFNWSRLCLAIAASATIVLAAGVLVEWWIRSRGGLFRWRLMDLLVGITCFAMVLGWLEYHRKIRRNEQAVIEKLGPDSTDTDIVDQPRFDEYNGPDWLRRLVGHEALLPKLHHITQANYWSDHEDPEQVALLAKLRYLEQLVVYEGITLDDLKSFPQLPRLDSLVLYEPFETKTTKSTGLEACLRPEQLELLSAIKTDSLELYDELVLVEDLRRYLSVSGCKRLVLSSPSITAEELKSLRDEFPEVEIEASWGEADQPPPNQAFLVDGVKRFRKLQAEKQRSPPAPQ